MRLISLFTTASLVGLVAAHAGPAPLTWKRDNLEARDTLERRCGSALAHKRAKRAEEAMNTVLARRGLEGSDVKIHPKYVPHALCRNTSLTFVCPRRSANQDSTCLVTPEGMHSSKPYIEDLS